MYTRRLHLVCWCLATAALLQGCGLTRAQREGVSTFGKAAASLGESSKDQFLAAREDVIQMKRLRLAIEKKILPQEKPDGSPASREYYSQVLDLDSGLDRENIDRRVTAVELLQRYGDLLIAFTEDSQEAELKGAAEKFTKSVEKFPDNPLSAEQIKGLGQLVLVTGGWLVEHEKKEALKEVIPTVAPLINKVCGSLEKDFESQRMGVAGNVYQAQDRLASEAVNGLKRSGDSLADRLLLIDGLALADGNKEKLDLESKRLLKATASLRKANEQLLQVLSHGKIGIKDIKEFGEDAADLGKAVKPFVPKF